MLNQIYGAALTWSASMDKSKLWLLMYVPQLSFLISCCGDRNNGVFFLHYELKFSF
jgi:hypothetical protein